jgi:hypothetical protein
MMKMKKMKILALNLLPLDLMEGSKHLRLLKLTQIQNLELIQLKSLANSSVGMMMRKKMDTERENLC